MNAEPTPATGERVRVSLLADQERDQIIESMEALELDENRLRQALTTTCPSCDEEVPVGGMRLHLKADHSDNREASDA